MSLQFPLARTAHGEALESSDCFLRAPRDAVILES